MRQLLAVLPLAAADMGTRSGYSNFASAGNQQQNFESSQLFSTGAPINCWEAAQKILLATENPAEFKAITQACIAAETGIHHSWPKNLKSETYWMMNDNGGIEFSPIFEEMSVTGAKYFDILKRDQLLNVMIQAYGLADNTNIDVAALVNDPNALEDFVKYEMMANMVDDSKQSRWWLSYLYKQFDDGKMEQDEWLDLAYEYVARNFLDGPLDFMMAQKLFKKAAVDQSGKKLMQFEMYRNLAQASQQDVDEIMMGRKSLDMLEFTPGKAKYNPNFKWYPHGPTVAPSFVNVENMDSFFGRATASPFDATTGEKVHQRFGHRHYYDNAKMMNSAAWGEVLANAMTDIFPDVDTSFLAKSYFSPACTDVPMTERKPCYLANAPVLDWTNRENAEDQCVAVGCCWEIVKDSNVPYCFQTEVAPTCGYEAKFDPASTKESLFQGSKQRLECGAPGISFDECTNLGCCYDDTMTTFIDAAGNKAANPWCYHKFLTWTVPLYGDNIDQCAGPDRFGCTGTKFDNMYSKEACEARGCCYQNTAGAADWASIYLSNGEAGKPASRCYMTLDNAQRLKAGK